MPTRLENVRDYEDYAERAQTVRLARQLLVDGRSLATTARHFGMSRNTLVRLLERWEKSEKTGNIMDAVAKKSTGRPPKAAEIPEEHLAAIRALYARSNAGKGQGSMMTAALVYARQEKCPESMRAAVDGWMRSGHIPRSVRRACAVSAQTRQHFRDPRALRLGTAYAPGTLRMTVDEATGEYRRLWGGEAQNWDDASINFEVCVPWIWGGDPCSDKWGVKVGRFQLLTGLDTASSYCPGFSFIIRGKEQYKGADATGAMLRCWREDVLPAKVVVEGGVWQSRRALDFYRLTGAEFVSAKGRPNLKPIEGYWKDLWTVLSCLIDGQIGRYRGEMKRETDELMRARSGAADPRRHFPGLETALKAIHEALAVKNAKAIHSPEYGTWVPAERYASDLAEHPRPALDPSVSWMLAPVRAERKIVRGMIRASVECPLVGSMPYHFVHPALYEFEGAPVAIYFDPWDSPIVNAVVALAAPFRGLPAGTIVTQKAECIDDAPVIGGIEQGFDVSFDLTGLNRALQTKKRYLQAARMEFRALKLDGKLHAVESEIRAPDGRLARVEIGSKAEPGQAVARAAALAEKPAQPELERPRVRSWMDLAGVGI